MIPTEVVTIAEVIALEYKGLAEDWENYESLAWKIYTALQKAKL